jgi:hypothetical protein
MLTFIVLRVRFKSNSSTMIRPPGWLQSLILEIYTCV